MQLLQNTTLQGGKYRIELMLKSEYFSLKKILLIIAIVLNPSLLIAQTAGGIIKRPTKSVQIAKNNKSIHKKTTSNPPKAQNYIITRKSNSIIIKICGVDFKLILVNGGSFVMGGTSEQGKDILKEERPTHSVTLSSFYIGETEVTQALWQAIMGDNPSSMRGDNYPVESVSWNDCKTFISKLNSITGEDFRLPTEAEWEYAARGGEKSKGYRYSGSNAINNVAWYSDNSGDELHPVKTKLPNELGIYDMSGNVQEWCQDWFDTYDAKFQMNPQGPVSGSLRVCRGGGWLHYANTCRVSYRHSSTPDSENNRRGFRLAL